MNLRIALSFAAALAAPLAAFAQDNPAARRGPNDFAMLAGTWNGANIERRSSCAIPQNDGQHGTYGQYTITVTGATMNVNEITLSGLFCNYSGGFVDDRFRPKWTGNYACSDGKSGNFESTYVLITPNEMQVRMDIQLVGSETCRVDSILGGSRF